METAPGPLVSKQTATEGSTAGQPGTAAAHSLSYRFRASGLSGWCLDSRKISLQVLSHLASRTTMKFWLHHLLPPIPVRYQSLQAKQDVLSTGAKHSQLRITGALQVAAQKSCRSAVEFLVVPMVVALGQC